MTSAMALKFPVAPGSLELAKSVDNDIISGQIQQKICQKQGT